jgi:hypothetical protein
MSVRMWSRRLHRRDGRTHQAGVAVLSALAVILTVSLLAVLLMYLTGKEIILSRNSHLTPDAFYTAEGGATVARAATIQLVENLSSNSVSAAGGAAALATDLANMYAGPNPTASKQNPIQLLDYAGFGNTRSCCLEIKTGATASTASFNYSVNGPDPNYPTKWIEASPGHDVYVNLGDSSYVAEITISRRLGTSGLYIDKTGGSLIPTYTFHYAYTIMSRGISSHSTRRVQLTHNFDVQIQPMAFAHDADFDDVFAPVPPGGTCAVLPDWWDCGPMASNTPFSVTFLSLTATPTWREVL